MVPRKFLGSTIYVILPLTCLIFYYPTYAGAWTVKAGNMELFATIYKTNTTHYLAIKNERDQYNYQHTQVLTQINSSVLEGLIAYGITDQLTLGVKCGFVSERGIGLMVNERREYAKKINVFTRDHYELTYKTQSGLSSIFFRQLLFDRRSVVFSIQPEIHLGAKHSLEMRWLAGMKFYYDKIPHFINIEQGLWGQRLMTDLTLGVQVSSTKLHLAQVFFDCPVTKLYHVNRFPIKLYQNPNLISTRSAKRGRWNVHLSHKTEDESAVRRSNNKFGKWYYKSRQ